MNNIHYSFATGLVDSSVKIVKKGTGSSTKTIASKQTSRMTSRRIDAHRGRQRRMHAAYEMANNGIKREQIAEKLGVTVMAVGKYINEMRQKEEMLKR